MENLKRTTPGFFSIHLKLLVLLVIIISFPIILAGTSLSGIYRIGQSSNAITEQEMPLLRSIQEALSAMITGQSTTERILDIDTDSDLSDMGVYEVALRDSILRFEMFMAAITWGSESEAFSQSNGGQNHTAWIAAGLKDELVVQGSSEEEIELAGQTSIYYEGFINNARRAIEARKQYLDLSQKGASKEAGAAKTSSKEFVTKARRFASLTERNLEEMARRSNEAASASAETLTATQNSVRTTTITVSILGLIISIIVNILFARRIIIQPLTELAATVETFGRGAFDSRATIHAKDEIGLLGTGFNDMASRLSEHTNSLEAEVASRTKDLQKNLRELDASNDLLKKRESELTIANQRLLELDKAKSEFISVAAHQLRTPLSAIKWTISLLIEDTSSNLTPEQKSLLMKGYESNERIINLVNRMLVVTRIESGKTQFKSSPLHLEDVVESVLLDFSSQAYVRRMHLIFDKPSIQSSYIQADPDMMRSVIQNIVENAVRYTPDEGTITISITSSPSEVQVAVRDSGIGIPSHQQSSIFNKFFRADNAVKTVTEGSGLGLYIVKSFVEKHGGKIWFESVEGAGTTFFFSIPSMQSAPKTA